MLWSVKFMFFVSQSLCMKRYLILQGHDWQLLRANFSQLQSEVQHDGREHQSQARRAEHVAGEVHVQI